MFTHVVKCAYDVSVSRKFTMYKRNLTANAAVLKLQPEEITVFPEQKDVPFSIQQLFQVNIQSKFTEKNDNPTFNVLLNIVRGKKS